MKLDLKFHTVLSIIFIFALTITTKGYSKRYSIEKIIINAEILPDGSLMIEEERHYLFHGSFSWAEYKLPLKKLGKVTDFSLSEQGNYYKNDQKSKKPGNYRIDQDNNKFYVKWFYKAENEQCIFKLNYRVEDVVTVYQDVADFHYKFVGNDNKGSIGLVEVTLKLLFAADTSRVKAWAHGPLNGDLKFDNGVLRFRISPLPKKRFWEARVIFPPTWVSNANKYKNFSCAEKIVQQEKQWVIEANNRRIKAQQKLKYMQENQGKMLIINVLLSALAVAIFMYLYNRFGRAYHPNFNLKYSSEIPKDLSPAITNYIYNAGQITVNALLATILDLAKWSYLKIDEKQTTKKGILGESKKMTYLLKLDTKIFEEDIDKLTSYELSVIDFLFNKLAAGKNEITFDSLKKSHGQLSKWFTQWIKLLKKHWGNHAIYDISSIKGMIISIIVSILLITSGIIMFIYFGEPGSISLIAGIVILCVSFIIPRFTKKVKLIHLKLTAFKNYLTKYYYKEERITKETTFEEYLIYAVALGVNAKIIENLLSIIPHDHITYHFPWYLGATNNSPVEFANALTSMITVANSNISSAAGIGGGASVGGSGAGGASGGAG